MKLLKFDNESLNKLIEINESGMDFYFVKGSGFNNLSLDENELIVRGNGKAAILHKNKQYYSLESIYECIQLPADEETVSFQNIVSVPSMSITLPSGYTSTIGAHPLLGTIKLKHPAKFYRYTSTQRDGRFNGTELLVNTYLTTFFDQLFVNTGFGATGRYALPLPVPASYEHVYTIQAGETLKVGTVAPNYGQSGGGVEVMTTGPTQANFEYTKMISDY